MHVLNQPRAPRYIRNGTTSYLLISEQTCGSHELSITMVYMEPGGVQRVHQHVPEQMYYLLAGEGIMEVDGEQRPVAAGDCVFIPSGAAHGLRNTGAGVLQYMSAASPSFTLEESKRLWPLPSLEKAQDKEDQP